MWLASGDHWTYLIARINQQAISTATVRLLIPTALGLAVLERDGHGAVAQCITAVALGAILDTRIGVTQVLAGADAGLHGHVAAGEGVSGEGTLGLAFNEAALGGVGADGGDEGRRGDGAVGVDGQTVGAAADLGGVPAAGEVAACLAVGGVPLEGVAAEASSEVSVRERKKGADGEVLVAVFETGEAIVSGSAECQTDLCRHVASGRGAVECASHHWLVGAASVVPSSEGGDGVWVLGVDQADNHKGSKY